MSLVLRHFPIKCLSFFTTVTYGETVLFYIIEIIQGVSEKFQDWIHKQFIAKNLYKLQVFSFKVISFESNAIFHSVLPCFHALLEGFFQDTFQFHRHSLLDGFHIWKMDSLDDLLELGEQKKQGTRSGE